MHKLHELKEKLIEELEDYSENGKFSKDDVESIKYITSAVDHICNIMERYDEEGYSNNMMYGGGSYEGSYMRGGNRGGSYARGGRGRRGGANQYGSYAMRGYSRASEDAIMELRNVMDDVQDERVRKEIHEVIKKIEGM